MFTSSARTTTAQSPTSSRRSGSIPISPSACGTAYYGKEDYDRAIADYDQANLIDPKLANVFANRSQAYDAKGDYQRAMADLDAAIALNPDYALGFKELCRRHARSGRDLQDALVYCEKSLRQRPDDSGALSIRGFVHLRLGQLDAAIADDDAALKLRPRIAEALYSRGLARRSKGDAAGAADDIAAAKAIQPDIADKFARDGVQ